METATQARLDAIREKAKSAEDMEKQLAELAQAKGTAEALERANAQVNEALKAQVVLMHGIGNEIRWWRIGREQYACERLLLVRLAARVYRAQTGAWPKTWQALVERKLLEPEMILVPATGKPFLMRTGADGRPEPYAPGYPKRQRDGKYLPEDLFLEPLKAAAAVPVPPVH